MDHSIKRFLFKYYALISGGAFIAAIALFTLTRLTWVPLAAICGGTLTFAFSVQKQQIEEVKLFRDLFDRFNQRYDDLNEKLNRIFERPDDAPLESSEADTLFKYFNLCGEEHLYFRQGFIYPEVWHSWKNGMNYFRENPRIRKLWDDELKTCSYYGLNFQQKGDSYENTA